MEVSHSFGSWGAESEAILRRIYPVHRACRDGDTETLALLIANGQHSGIYQEDQFYGWTPAHWAAYFGKLECLCNLVSHGVNIDIATKRFNQTPTHIASFAVQPHCLLWLIKAGADINRQDYLGETAVHKAARSGTVECLGLLQAQGAYLRAPNNNGHTPSQLAISCGNQHCALYIEQCSPKEITHNGFHHNGHQSNGFHPCNGVNKLPQFISRKRALEEEEPCLFKKSRTDDSRIGDIHDVAMTSAEPAEYTKCCSTSSTPSLGVKRHITSMPQALGFCNDGPPVAAHCDCGTEAYNAIITNNNSHEPRDSNLENHKLSFQNGCHPIGLSSHGVEFSNSMLSGNNTENIFSTSRVEHQKSVQCEQRYYNMMINGLF